MPFSEHGPNNCLVLYQVDRGKFGFPTDLFICTHGGIAEQFRTPVPPRGQLYFWGSHGDTITANQCCQIMSATHSHKVKSIAGPGSLVWDYELSEFPGDWAGATMAVTDAFKLDYKNRYDCVMVNDHARLNSIVRLSDVFAAFPGYPRYHFMACRVEDGVPRSEEDRIKQELWKKSLNRL